MAEETITGTGTTSLRLDRTDDATAFAQFTLASSRRLQLQMVAAVGGASVIDLDPQVQDNAGECMVRVGRLTQTAGHLAGLVVFKGDATATINHLLAGNADSYLAAALGRVGIGTVEPQYLLDVAGDLGVSGSLRLTDQARSHVIGSGTVDTSRQLLLTGTFTGSAEAVALGVNTDLYGLPEADISLVKINGTVHSAVSGTNRIQTCLMIKPSFATHGAENDGTYGAVIRQFEAPSNAPVATGLAVDCPTGAPVNHAMQIGGPLLQRGAAPIYFSTVETTFEAMIGRATVDGAYVEGSETDDLIFRSEHHAMWWSTDAGSAHLKLTPDAFTLFVPLQIAVAPVTGSGSPSWGSNCPAANLAHPAAWLPVRLADGSTAYVPVYQ